MIDLKLLRENPDAVRRSQLSRGEDPALVDALLRADADRRAAISAADSLRAEQKTASKSVGSASAEERPAKLAHAKELAEQVKAAESAQAEAEAAFTAAHMAISNVILDPVPAGGEDDYVVLDVVGEPAAIDNPKDHLELGESLGLIDMQRGAKVSGSRFYFLTGHGALLQLGLLQLALRLAVENGFIPMIPPVLVRPEVMAGTGFLGAHADEVYRVEADDLYLVGTSEVPLAGYHSDEILDLSGGPLRYAGWSSCFRREAGSYGKDTRGIIRVHQFDKVEGFVYCEPAHAEAEHERLLGWQREMLKQIEVPYRVIDIAAGDLGSSAARKFDCEAWVPTQGTYRELTSTSNCTTFQARRLATRYRDENGKPQIAATLNGTLGTTRWLVSILENHQRPDGSVRVPAALVPYVGTELLEPRWARPRPGARSVAEGAPVGVDEGARCGPAAFQRHRGDVMMLGQQHHRVMQAQLGPPLWEGHRQLVGEQPAERALADADSIADLLQAQRLGQIVGDQRARLAQPGVDRRWNPQWLMDTRRAQLIVQDAQHPVMFVGMGGAGLRTGDDEFAHQRIDREHSRCRRAADCTALGPVPHRGTACCRGTCARASNPPVSRSPDWPG